MFLLFVLAETTLCEGPGLCPSREEILSAAKEQHDTDNAALMVGISAADPGVHFTVDRYPPRISHIVCGAPWLDEAEPRVECSFQLRFRHTRTYEVAQLKHIKGRWRIDRVERVIRQR